MEQRAFFIYCRCGDDIYSCGVVIGTERAAKDACDRLIHAGFPAYEVGAVMPDTAYAKQVGVGTVYFTARPGHVRKLQEAPRVPQP